MKTTKELNAEIKKLKQTHRIEKSVVERLPFIDPEKISVFSSGYKDKRNKTIGWFTIELHSEGYPFNKKGMPLKDIRENLQKIISAFHPTQLQTIYMASNDVPTASHFTLSWDNPCRGQHKAKLNWISGDFECHVSLPIDFYSDDVKGIFMRGIYDSEYHYFTGQSASEIRRIQVCGYKLDMFESIKYYGGNVTNYTNNSDEKESFEFLLLNGHIEAHADFWQGKLIEKSKEGIAV